MRALGRLLFAVPLFLAGIVAVSSLSVAAPAHIQGGSNSSVALSTTISVVLGATVVNSDAIAGYVTWDNTSGVTLSSIKDDKSNSTIVDTINDTGDGQSTTSFYLVNITNHPTRITATFTKAIGWRPMVVDEYSGIATVSALDGHRSNVQMNVGAGSNAVTSRSFATTRSGDLIYGVTFDSYLSSASPLAGTGFYDAAIDWYGQPFADHVRRCDPKRCRKCRRDIYLR